MSLNGSTRAAVVDIELKIGLDEMVTQYILPVLGILGVGSIIAQYLGRVGERRAARGRALEALRKLEQYRWAYDDDAHLTFHPAVHAFESAAMVALVPRQALNLYIPLVWAAFWESTKGLEDFPNERGGAINPGLSSTVLKAAGIVVDLLWRPRLGRWRLEARHAAVKAFAEEHMSPGAMREWQQAIELRSL